MKTFTIAIGIMATFIIFVGYTVIYIDEKKRKKDGACSETIGVKKEMVKYE